MSKPGIVTVSALGGIAFVLLLAWVTWTYVFDNIDRGMVLMFWGTLTSTGSLGGQ